MLRVLRRTALATKSLAVCGVLVANVARAEPPAPADTDPLPAARALFAEALHDEEAGRFADALDKFQRVRAVRDTASVEYRIGSCSEGLGDPVAAYRAYLTARTLAAGDPQSGDIGRAASERLDALSKKVAQLTVVTPPPSPPATAPAAPEASAEPPPSAPPPPVEAPPPATNGSLAVAGWAAVGGGAGLVAASAILLVVRENEAVELNDQCPNGACTSRTNMDELLSMHKRAEILGPVGVTCGIAGVALAAAGIYWIASAHRQATATGTWQIVPMLADRGAGLAFTRALR
jgi:hypothetical protein